KISQGMQAAIWFDQEDKESVAKAYFNGIVPERWPQVAGRVVAVSNDGQTIILEQSPRGRGDEPRRFDIKLTVATRISFSSIGPDEAKVTEGYLAQAQLVDGSRAPPLSVTFSKSERGR